MISKLNGEENYFTRICVSGLLNTRKLELAHMLLQDISMFHAHPGTPPDPSLDSKRFISAAVSNLASNDRRNKAHTILLDSARKTTTHSLLAPNSTNLSKSLSNLTLKSVSNVSKNSSSRNELNTDTESTISSSHDKYEQEVASLNDLASFISYGSRKPSKIYQPIKEQSPGSVLINTNESRAKHKVSYLKVDDNPKLDYHLIQALQNGFTFACVLNEWEITQSSYLLNIRLESDNSTLVWSRPSWDISNSWEEDTVNNPTNVINQNVIEGAGNVQTVNSGSNRRLSKARSSLVNNPLLLSLDAPGVSFQSKSESYLRRKLLNPKTRAIQKKLSTATFRPKFNMSANLTGATLYKPGQIKSTLVTHEGTKSKNNNDDSIGNAKTAGSSFNESDELVYDYVDQNIVYSVHSLTKRYVYRETVSFNDPFEGFIDLHCVKHIRLGCLDAQTFISLQQIAIRYAIHNFDHSNIICLVYGSTFSENRLIEILLLLRKFRFCMRF